MLPRISVLIKLSKNYNFQDSRVEPTVVITFKIHLSGAEDIKCLAKVAGIPVSQYIRNTMAGILSHSFPDRTKELLEMIAERKKVSPLILLLEIWFDGLYIIINANEEIMKKI